MKSTLGIILIIFALSNSHAREKHFFNEYFPMSEMILGEWELEKTIMAVGDSVHYELLPNSKKSITIDKKSIVVHRDSIKYSRRIWRINEAFDYGLSYSSGTKSGFLYLYHEEFKKKRKKRRAWASYIVEKCDFSHLILYQIEQSPLSESDYSNYVYYIYTRKQTNKFGIDDFAGTWYYFSDSLNLNLSKLGDEVVLKNEIDTSLASQFEYHHKINFQSNIFKNRLLYSSKTNQLKVKEPFSEVISGGPITDGVYIKHDNYSGWDSPFDGFWIDFQNQLIYLLHESISVYQFNFDFKNDLILTFDEEKTKSISLPKMPNSNK